MQQARGAVPFRLCIQMTGHQHTGRPDWSLGKRPNLLKSEYGCGLSTLRQAMKGIGATRSRMITRVFRLQAGTTLVRCNKQSAYQRLK